MTGLSSSGAVARPFPFLFSREVSLRFFKGGAEVGEELTESIKEAGDTRLRMRGLEQGDTFVEDGGLLDGAWAMLGSKVKSNAGMQTAILGNKPSEGLNVGEDERGRDSIGRDCRNNRLKFDQVLRISRRWCATANPLELRLGKFPEKIRKSAVPNFLSAGPRVILKGQNSHAQAATKYLI